ncbi:methionine aminopeptidase [Fimbriimonas ginsengisoli Gsoil 348]|uniref:Methionine aminopeptidase n=2 Tax=Fimbriimonas ginsengisoli TaxID=1005039 RepID=A0A068NRA5_FIMGI|nr:methionine aminopeptidase [Fimbriimonas ginsengisoli Gsoil 348]
MAEAGRAAAKTLRAMREAIVPGKTTTLDLEEVARESLRSLGAKPALLGYKPAFSEATYQHATCISINEQVIHGVPGPRVLRNGDVVSLDLVADVDGWLADTTITVPVGEVSTKAQRLIEVTRAALVRAVEVIRPGLRLGDLGNTIQKIVERNGFSVIRELAGHGVGRTVHEEGLDVFNFGRPGTGLTLRPGMTFAVEPMVSVGKAAVEHRLGDPWTIYTKDKSLAAHWEHTVAVTEDGCRVLTRE